MEKTTKVKTALSAGIVVLCVIFTAMAASGETYVQGTDGLIVDFGEGVTYFGAFNSEDDLDANEGLEYTCAVFGFDLDLNGDDVVSIDSSVSGTDGKTWNLYVVEKASSELQQTYPWVKISGDPGEVKIKGYAAVAWAYCSEDETPSRAVDATGVCFYGYGHPQRIVSLAPPAQR